MMGKERKRKKNTVNSRIAVQIPRHCAHIVRVQEIRRSGMRNICARFSEPRSKKKKMKRIEAR